MKTYTIPAIVLTCLAACSAPSTRGEQTSVATETPLEFAMPPDSNILEPGKLPTPYSANEIRDANPPGSWKVYRITARGRTVLQRFEFRQCPDPEFSAVSIVMSDESGTSIGTQESVPARWSALQAHGSYDAARTLIDRDRVSLKAGEFDCWTYVVDGADGEMNFFWFATELPGTPVLLETRVNGKSILRMELEAFGLPEPESEPLTELDARDLYLKTGKYNSFAGAWREPRQRQSSGAALLNFAAVIATSMSPNGRVTEGPQDR